MISIEIEVGTSKDRKRWKAEIESILSLFGKDSIINISLTKIIIPVDFNKTVCELEELEHYESNRYTAEVFAKSIHKSINENYIVIASDKWKTFDNLKFKSLMLVH